MTGPIEHKVTVRRALDLAPGQITRHPETRRFVPIAAVARVYDVNLNPLIVEVSFGDGVAIRMGHDRTLPTYREAS